MKRHLALTFFLLMTGLTSAHAQGISAEVRDLFENHPIFDGLQSLLYHNRLMPDDFRDITRDTGINGMTGKLSGTASGIQSHINSYVSLSSNSTINFGLTTRDFSCKDVQDDVLELVIYQQKPWPLSFTGNDNADKRTVIANAELWAANGLRILQLEYSPRANGEYYLPGQQYAGTHRAITDPSTCSCADSLTPACSSRTDDATYYQCTCQNDEAASCSWVNNEAVDPGLTKYGRWMAEALLKQGVMLDVSHSRDATVTAVVKLATELALKKNRAVPVMITHGNIDSAAFRRSARNKSLDEMCAVASTGGTISVDPIKNFLPEDATLFNLGKQLDVIRQYNCKIKSWDGKTINMIDHIGVATDSYVDYYLPDRKPDSTFYVDALSASTRRWQILATYMRQDNDGDGDPDFSITDIKKIFGGNTLAALRRGLRGQLPFDNRYCSIDTQGKMFTGDFNGDSKADLLYHTNSGGTFINYSANGGQFEKINWARDTERAQGTDRSWCSLTRTQKMYVGDFNGDGRDDVLCHNSRGRSYIDFADRLGRFRGSNWARHTDTHRGIDTSWCAISTTRKLYVGDFNGDGRDDVLCHNSEGQSWVSHADANGHLHRTNWSRTRSAQDKNWCRTNTTRKLFVDDFDGDGRDDLLCHNQGGKTFIDYSANGLSQTDFSRSVNDTWCKIGTKLSLKTADITGDGRADLICHSNDNGKVWLSYANQRGRFGGTSSSSNYSFCKKSHESLHVNDVTGDKRDDLLCFSSNEGYLSMLVTGGRRPLEKE